MNSDYHRPVLLQKAVDLLVQDENGIYADATFGGGGHSAEILSRLKGGKLIAFDQDEEAEQNAAALKNCSGFYFIRSNFTYIRNFLRLMKLQQIDGLTADLGVSSHQFDKAERGFSFRFKAKPDMRMNRKADKTAESILNTASVSELYRIFKNYGELKKAKYLAERIVAERQKQVISDTQKLNEMLMPLAPKHREYKFLAKVYQALRIEVNDETDALEKLLKSCADLIKPGGRIVFITYHSLEDRLVKNFIKTGRTDGKLIKDIYGKTEKPFEAVNRKPITPEQNETVSNNRARSAKLRAAEKTESE